MASQAVLQGEHDGALRAGELLQGLVRGHEGGVNRLDGRDKDWLRERSCLGTFSTEKNYLQRYLLIR